MCLGICVGSCWYCCNCWYSCCTLCCGLACVYDWFTCCCFVIALFVIYLPCAVLPGTFFWLLFFFINTCSYVLLAVVVGMCLALVSNLRGVFCVVLDT